MFLRKHWPAFAAFIAAAILAVAGAVYVFVWFTGDAQATGLVPAALGMWTMGNIVAFILHAIFWELVLIGIPVAIGAVAAWQWWKRLPEEEKSTSRLGNRLKVTQSRRSNLAVAFHRLRPQGLC